MLGRKSNEQIAAEKAEYLAAMEFHAKVLKEIMGREDELSASKADVRDAMEETMRKFGFDKYPLAKVDERRLLLKVKLEKSKPRRKFEYDNLYEEDQDLYNSLIKRGFIGMTVPSSPYRMTMSRLKATKAEVARGIHVE